MSYDAIVIGGGLAGCSVAHQLARRDHSVLLLEQSTYPRHKLCGEFLSPEAQSSLEGLGVLSDVREAGAASMRGAALTGPGGTATEHALPGTALGLSRYRLDELLYRQACAAGVEGRTGTRATAVHGSLDEGFAVEAGGDTVEGRLVIGAYGRRGVLDRTLERPFLQEHSPYVAFKAHFAGPADRSGPGAIEIHAAAGGYCGVGPVEDDCVNVCWIGRTDALKDAGGTPDAMLDRLRGQNDTLDARLRPLSRVSERYEAVSQVPLMPKSRFTDDVCMVGDSAGMIAPLCGDGMAMALDAADLLAPLADQFLRNRPADAFRRTYDRQWRRTFGRRMRIGRWVHAAAFRPTLTSALLKTCTTLPPLARWLIRATRG